jgi:hypothetical protein
MFPKYKTHFSKSAIEKALLEHRNRIGAAVVMRLKFAGETFVTNARLNGSYNDITGNLRSSVGYIVATKGELIVENYQKVKSGSKGIEKAKAFVEKILKKYQHDYVLIAFAGENYAAHVEARGRDVITGSCLQLKKDLNQALAKFKKLQ